MDFFKKIKEKEEAEREEEELLPYKAPHPAWKVFGKLLKVLMTLVLVSVFVIPCVRIFMLNSHPNEAVDLIWTESSKASYKSDPDAFHTYKIKMGDSYSKLGYFFFIEGSIVEDEAGRIEQIQLTMRYNDSTVTYFEEESGESSADEPFVFVLCDEKGNCYLPDVTVESENGNLNYRRLLFDNVDMSGVDTLAVNVYSANNFDLSSHTFADGKDENAFATVLVYTSQVKMPEYKLSKRETAWIDR